MNELMSGYLVFLNEIGGMIIHKVANRNIKAGGKIRKSDKSLE